VALAALAGQWVGGEGAERPQAARLAAPPVVLGPARVVVPSDWRPLPLNAAGVESARSELALAFDTAPGLPVRAVLVAGGDPSAVSRSLVPQTLRDAVAREPRSPRPGRLDGYRTWTYSGVPLRSGDGSMDITVLPTTAGVLAVSCAGPRYALPVSTGCASTVRVSLAGASAIPPREDLAFRLRLDDVLQPLDGVRVARRAMLRQADEPAAQRLAAGRLARAHGRAASALAPLSAEGPSAQLVAALRGSRRAYGALGAAADDRAAFMRAARSVEAADARLARSLAALSERPRR
jgi:hypothetical protein